MHPAIDLTVKFLLSQGLDFRHSLTCLRLKVLFLSSSKKLWSDMFAEIVELGLETVVASVPSEAAVQPTGWLRSVIFIRIACDIEQMDVKTCDAKRSDFAAACYSIAKRMERLSNQIVFATAAADIETLAIFISLGCDYGCDHLSAAKAYEISEELGKPKFTLLKCVLDRSSGGPSSSWCCGHAGRFEM